jgi:hypothetical protein
MLYSCLNRSTTTFEAVLIYLSLAEAEARSQRKEKTPVDAESSEEEEEEDDQSSATELSSVTDLSETRRQLNDELGDAALNRNNKEKDNEG